MYNMIGQKVMELNYNSGLNIMKEMIIVINVCYE